MTLTYDDLCNAKSRLRIDYLDSRPAIIEEFVDGHNYCSSLTEVT